MIVKLSKDQVTSLRKVLETRFGQPINKNAYIVQVRELKYKTVETSEGWKKMLLPQDADESNNPKGGVYPQYVGMIVEVSDEIKTIKRGDIVRFSPLCAEVFTAVDIDYSIIICQIEHIRGVDINIHEYEGENEIEETSEIQKKLGLDYRGNKIVN